MKVQVTKIEENKICEDYINGISRRAISEKYNLDPRRINKIVSTNHITLGFKINVNEHKICSDIISGISKARITKKYSISKKTINKIIKLYNVKPIDRHDINIKNMCDEYISGITKKDIMKKYSISQRKLGSIFKENDIKRENRIIDEISICNDYVLSGATKTILVKKYELTRGELEKVFEKNNIISAGGKRSKYSIDETFFEKIDTKEKAYILGYLYADGTINKKKTKSSLVMSFEIQERDAYILEKINVIMKNTRPIYFRKKRKESQQNQKKIDIISDKICNDLINLGMNFRKTWDLRYPDFIDKEFQGDFIRGFFDGDGCICKNKKINNAMWYICGNLQMVIDIKNHLFRQGIEATVYESDRYSQPFGIVYITNLKNIKKIYNYMYDNVDDLFLTRKKEKFLQLDFKKMEYFNVKRDIVEILYLAGETTSEIAKRLKYTYAEVHNAIKSIENKIKKAQL